MKMKFYIMAFIIFTIKHVQSENSESPDYLSKGIVFHQSSKIILAEKFVNVEFLLPFPEYNFTTRKSIHEMLQTLTNMWKMNSSLCPLDFSTKFNTTADPFNLNWMLEKLENEINETKNEVEQIREESASFLTKTDAYRGREKRAAHVGAAILAGIGIFGGGILLGNSDCGITGIFGNCQESGRKNAENIDRLNRFTSILTDYVVEFEENTNEKFFMVSNELSEIRKAQKEIRKSGEKLEKSARAICCF